MAGSGIIFVIIGVAFAVIGFMNNMRLKKFFFPFYQDNRVMLIAATLGLSIPLILRGTIDIIHHFSETAKDLIDDNMAVYDTVLFLIGDIIPISF